MKSDFLIAVTQLASERNLPREMVLSAIEAALVSAYRKDNQTAGQNISVRLDPSNGEISVYTLKAVVEAVEEERKEISLAEAHLFKPDAQIDDTIEIETTSYTMGRIAAQTAKQVVIQRLREAERELVFEEYAEKEGDILNAIVQRLEVRQIIVDLGRAEAILPPSEQVMTERYRPNQRLKVYVLGIQQTGKGPEIIVSRTHPDLLKRLFELEVPEIFNGVVEIMGIAREPGNRSKVAVAARQEGVDPVGSCVGLRGIRIQNIVNELQGEKIDVVQWHRDPTVFIANALSPAQALRVETNPDENTATVVVAERQLSLAIGKEGQNARLAAKLTGWRVDIKSSMEFDAERHHLLAEVPAPLTLEEEVAAAEQGAIVTAEEVVALPSLVIEAAPEPEPVAVEPTAQAEALEEVPLAVEQEERKSALTPEEALLMETLEATPEVEAAPTAPDTPIQEEAEEEDLGEDVWTLPTLSQATSGIRFAEDIMGPRVGRGGRRRRRRGEQEDGEAASSRGSKGRQATPIPTTDETTAEETTAEET